MNEIRFNPRCRRAPSGSPPRQRAQPIDTPYVGFGVTCGITFTFGGLKVDTRAQVLDTDDRPIPGLYAAGELVGGLFYQNYPGGAGLTSGAVFGKTAGDCAAAYSSARRPGRPAS
jgi:tricarballylate dehydrogenase